MSMIAFEKILLRGCDGRPVRSENDKLTHVRHAQNKTTPRVHRTILKLPMRTIWYA